MMFEFDSGRSEDSSTFGKDYSEDSFQSQFSADSLEFAETLRDRLVLDQTEPLKCSIAARSNSPLVRRPKQPLVTKYYAFSAEQDFFSDAVSEARAVATIRCTNEGRKALTSVKSIIGTQGDLNAAQLAACETYLRSPQFIETVNFDFLGYKLREKYYFGNVTLYIYGIHECGEN
jgi:hypothetical protein